MDGVLRIAKEPIEGVQNLFRQMQKKDIPGMICTNECRYTTEELREDLEEMDIEVPPQWHIYTAGMTTF